MKISFVILSIIFLAGCASLRNTARRETKDPGTENNVFLYRDIFEQNNYEKGIYIRKASIEFFNDQIDEKFSLNIRISQKGEWLVSVRSFAGIEVVRIFANKEEVVLLDRLARSASIIGWQKIFDMYGVNYRMISLLFGDVPDSKSDSRTRMSCSDFVELSTSTGKYSIKADCVLPRPYDVNIDDLKTKISYREYSVYESVIFPAEISIAAKGGSAGLTLKIEELEVPWNGDIEFSVPANYKIMR